MTKRYLGDGVYFDTDDFQIILTVKDGYSNLEEIFINHEVFINLISSIKADQEISFKEILKSRTRDLHLTKEY